MIVLKMLLIVAAVYLVLLAAAVVYLFRFACVRKKEFEPDLASFTEGSTIHTFLKQLHPAREALLALPHEDVEITSFDGLRLRARFFPAEASAPSDPPRALLMMHGHRSSGLFDFSVAASFYRSLGFHLLIVDQRACGRSEGRYMTFGAKERYDCAAWLAYLDDRFGGNCKLFMTGVSLGASTVLTASVLDIPNSVCGVIADCGFTSAEDIFRHVLRRNFHLPAFPILSAAQLLARATARFGFRDASTLDAMRENRLPVLFLHGGKDDFVPTEMTHRNYEACRAKKRMLIIEDASHGMSYVKDAPRCQAEIRAFLSDVLGEPI